MVKNRRDMWIFILMLILVPLAGEPKFHPFGGDFDSFRVSFGSPIFLLFLLWIRHISFTTCGLATGISVVCFRAFLDVWNMDLPIGEALWDHTPTFFYYSIYAICFLLPYFDKTRIYSKAMQIAGWAVVAEVIASIAELSAMQLLFYGTLIFLTPAMLIKITAIAFLRCFFILSFFFLTQLYATETRLHHEQHERTRMMLLISNLYEEIIQLSKSQKNAETITHDCYKIYDRLHQQARDPEKEALAREILAIAGQLHEIKKDNQRIYAGLSALTNNHRIADYEKPAELARLILDAQRKYARSLKKDIDFSSNIDAALPALHVYTLLSLVNNLIANAVEAIHLNGRICLTFGRDEETLLIKVENTGSAIPERKLSLIFKPGYTTKFDSAGNASTGIGLNYVRDLAGSLGGSAAITSDGKNEVCCTLSIPLSSCTAPQKPLSAPLDISSIRKD